MRLSSRATILLAALLATGLLIALPVPAFAQLTKATSAVTKLKDWLWVILPVICLIAGGICGLLYSFDVIRKETAYQWAAGVTFAGAIAGGIIELVF
ncbi:MULTISPECIES: TrbC/VirB2 family protein [Achromobacter]|uniref:TrbC/VirB2 family protein n=1 Tax=Achromobacter TaxID=222 RepID=UPI000C25B290|nr:MULTISPECIES: TrbC/VirB2 family protein [Achromobacter]PJM88748.1 hypothetical protein CV044_13115 [Achromobacter ruhlandii]WOB74372.1 hypothetical protein PZA07_02495 [Achromobacter xylosoxidans]BEG77412.1 hypothetical protein HBIAX_04501 [Achromobacter xylosoxidans]